MKRIFSILVILMLLFNSAGYIIVYFQLKSFFKKEAFNKLENFVNQEDLTTIILSKYEFENQNDNFYFVEPHEIKYYGKMYDISRIEYEKETVKIIALSDENETNLNNLFAQFFSKILNDNYSKIASILSTLICDSGLPITYDNISSCQKEMCFEFDVFSIFYGFIDILTPPPKNLICESLCSH